MEPGFPFLFSPLRLRGVVLKNRIFSTGHDTNLAAGGRTYYMTTGGVNKATGVAAAGKLIGYALDVTVTGATTAKVQLLAGPMPLETQA